MGQTLTEKLLAEHLVEGELDTGEEIGIEIDQVLLQDTTGTMAWLQFEALGLDEVETEIAAQYCDHQSYQFDFRNTDDHAYLKSATGKFGAYFSRPGNGVCHQVHHERFARPGQTLLGSDSHTPTQGGIGMLSIGAGGLDVASAMGGSPYYLETPEVVNVRLTGDLPEWATGKDVVLELLRRLTVKGGVGKVFEYTGPGVETLPVSERCAIANMGTELGATSSVFPTDDVTREYMEKLGRPEDFTAVGPDPNATYDDRIEIDLSTVEPLVATPSMPDLVVPVSELAGEPVDQVIVGSCTNGAYEDLRAFCDTLGDEVVHEDVHAIVQPASKQASELLARDGTVAKTMAAGVNWSEATCGACCGVGHVPGSDSTSVRTFNRNFEGRSGISDDNVYLVSPQVAAAAAVEGAFVDPRDYGTDRGIDDPGYPEPDRFDGSNRDLIAPPEGDVELQKGPNIGTVPVNDELTDDVAGDVLLRVGDDVTTDHIMPASSDILMYRSNVAKIAEFTLTRIDESFPERALAADGGFVVAGENYGQGSSREHAALCPMYLGVDAVIAKSFARIHEANLVNFGLLPLTFADPDDYEALEAGNRLRLTGLRESIARDEDETELTVVDETTGEEIPVILDVTERERKYLLDGGRLAHVRASQ
ncbi:aconitate hydratase [Halorarius litoreus]|uniref:aconitate hydratase n=1 Tax=Halorarius litoreus TaxID=2962676 RepID=UPI0020CCFD87|nr:aconitate hydratase [Halorarius litoreus]